MLPTDAWNVQSSLFGGRNNLSNLRSRRANREDSRDDSGSSEPSSIANRSLISLLPSFIEEADGGFVDMAQLHAVLGRAPKADSRTRQVGILG